MKLLLSAPTFTEVGLLQSQLESAGIACIIRNEHLSAVAGSIPFFDCYPELWVLNDADESRARDLLAKLRDTDSLTAAPWKCPDCGEEIEGQFESCWQCGAEKS
jgi:hypothetical protein